MSEEIIEKIEQKNANSQSKESKKLKKPIISDVDKKIRKAKRTKASVAAFVLLLAVGVMGNWYYDNTDLSSKVEPLINTSTNGTKTLGEAEYVDATTEISEEVTSQENEYFASARMDRQNARDESLEKLQNIINSAETSEDAKANAQAKITEISGYIAVENKIETLVSAKGVNNCLAVISEDGSRVDVIVDVEELSDNIIVQIKEVAMQQLGCSFENVSIIQSK